MNRFVAFKENQVSLRVPGVDQRSQFLIVRSGALEPKTKGPKTHINPSGMGLVKKSLAVGEASRSSFSTDAQRVHTRLNLLYHYGHLLVTCPCLAVGNPTM